MKLDPANSHYHKILIENNGLEKAKKMLNSNPWGIGSIKYNPDKRKPLNQRFPEPKHRLSIHDFL